MKFQKGHVKTGGKKKGNKNKKTLIIDTFATHIVEGGMERFSEELAILHGRDYVNAYMLMFEYVKPKLARTELSGNLDVKNTINDTTKYSLKIKEWDFP